MKSTALALCGLLLGTAGPLAMAEGDVRWQMLAQSDDEEWSSQRDSMTVNSRGSSTTFIAINGRMFSKKTRHVDLVQWTVTLDDCHADYGKLITSDMSGKYVVPFDYAKSSVTFESITAQAICNAYFNANK